jgi:rubrerythrin
MNPGVPVAATTPIVICVVCLVSWTSYKAEANWVCPSCKGKQ